MKEIHVISVQNEVKEVLFILEKECNEKLLIKTINIHKKGNQKFDFKPHEEISSKYSEPSSYLYEPNAAILKSGGFHQISNQLNVFKLHQHSHLYTSDTLVDFPGRVFKIENVISYDKKKIWQLLPAKKANISVRNFPETVAQIRKKTKIKDGGDHYLFFTTNHLNKRVVLICRKA